MGLQDTKAPCRCVYLSCECVSLSCGCALIRARIQVLYIVASCVIPRTEQDAPRTPSVPQPLMPPPPPSAPPPRCAVCSRS